MEKVILTGSGHVQDRSSKKTDPWMWPLRSLVTLVRELLTGLLRRKAGRRASGGGEHEHHLENLTLKGAEPWRGSQRGSRSREVVFNQGAVPACWCGCERSGRDDGRRKGATARAKPWRWEEGRPRMWSQTQQAGGLCLFLTLIFPIICSASSVLSWTHTPPAWASHEPPGPRSPGTA